MISAAGQSIFAIAVLLAAAIPPAEIRGRVSLARNRPIAGAVVLVESGRGGSLLLTATDLRGEFRVGELDEGEYGISIRKDGFRPWTRDRLEVKPPFRAIVEATLEPGDASSEKQAARVRSEGEAVRVGGVITGADGKPAVGARARLGRVDGTLDPREIAVGAEGRVEIPDLPAGRWRVEVLDPGSIPLRASLDFDRDVELRITLVAQPPDYRLSPEDLMPPEEAIPPESLVREP